MGDGLSGIKKIRLLNMLKMGIGSIKTGFIKMKRMNFGVGGGT